MDKIAEYQAQQERLETAGAKMKFGSATSSSWMIEVVFTDRDGIGDLMTLTSVAEVSDFIRTCCPECRRIDRRRTKGGLCRSCARDAGS